MSSPFRGIAFTRINDAARDSRQDADPNNDVGITTDDDMCEIARGSGADQGLVNANVAHRCDQRDALGKVSIATGVLAGVSLLAAASFLAIKLRRSRAGKADARRVMLTPSLGRNLGFVLSGSF